MMNDRYYMFRKILDFVNDDFTITDADIKTYSKSMVVEGVCPEGSIRIEVFPNKEKEVEQNAEELE